MSPEYKRLIVDALRLKHSDAINDYINRALTESKFIERKSPFFGKLLKVFSAIAKHLTQFIPMALIPIIDCRITGKSK